MVTVASNWEMQIDGVRIGDVVGLSWIPWAASGKKTRPTEIVKATVTGTVTLTFTDMRSAISAVKKQLVLKPKYRNESRDYPTLRQGLRDPKIKFRNR